MVPGSASRQSEAGDPVPKQSGKDLTRDHKSDSSLRSE